MSGPKLGILLILFGLVQLPSPIAAEQQGITHTLVYNGTAPGTDEQIIVWVTEYAPGAANPRHRHAAAVTFRVLSGTGIWQEEGQPAVTLKSGDSLLAPADTVHAHWNPSHEQ